MLHQDFFDSVNAGNWTTIPVGVAIFGAASTYVPAEDDLAVSTLDPASNEVDVAGYARQTLSSQTVMRSGGMPTLKGGTVSFGALDGDTAKLIVFYRIVGDGTDDSANRVLKTSVVDEAFDGGSFNVALPSGVFAVGDWAA